MRGSNYPGEDRVKKRRS